MNRVYISTLGCAKNLTDSEIMAALIEQNGFILTDDAQKANIGIVNTCGFIESAKEESINEILEIAEYKKNSVMQTLIVTGCLAERYSKELKDEIPEIDYILGTTSFPDIARVLKGNIDFKGKALLTDINLQIPENLPKKRMTEPWYAYLKISEGCDKHCTYCIIPRLRGKYRSRRIENLVEEATKYAEDGVKELIIIAQDTTMYGTDLYGEKKLSKLLYELNKIDKLNWIRILYSYPEDIDDDFITAVKNSDKILPYFDMPIQHCSDNILKLMNRKTSKKDIINKIKKIRLEIPNAVLRTTLMVGFPGETEEDFEELCEFVKHIKFDRLGVFSYSAEENTPAFQMPNQISSEIKEKRRDKVMQIQQKISAEKNRSLIGKKMSAIVEERVEENLYAGRTWRDMVEVDGNIYIKSEKILDDGEIVNIIIDDFMEYDLFGEIINELAE